MKGLLYKDIRLLFNIAKFFFVSMCVLLAVGMIFPKSSMMLAFAVIFISSLVTSTLSYDEIDRWDVYSGVLPVSKAQYVSSKYILSLLLSVPAVLIASAGYIINHGFGKESVSYIFIYILLGLFYPAIAFPLIFKYGYAKGKIAVVLIGAVSGAAGALAGNSDFIYGQLAVSPAIFIAAGSASIVLFAISWAISVAVYRKKEF